MPQPARTPQPPYYAVVFTSVRTPADPAGYEAMAERMGPEQPLPPGDPKSALAAFTVPAMADGVNKDIDAALQESGVTDLSAYNCTPGSQDLRVDLWVDTANPPGYTGP